MITNRDLGRILGLTNDQIKILVFHYDFKTTKKGKATILDPDSVRDYAENVLAKKVDELERLKAALADLRAYLDDPKQQADKIEDWVTLSEAVEIVPCTKPTLRKLIDEGVLEGRWLNDLTRVVRRDSLEANRDFILSISRSSRRRP